LEDIARDAGVGSATLHRHFRGRNALIAAVYRSDIEDLCTEVDDFLARSPADEALAEWMCLAVERTMARRGMAVALKATADEMTEFHDITVIMRSALTRLLAEAAAQGLIRGDVSAREMVHALGGFCLFDDQPGASNRALRLVRLLVDGLRHGTEDRGGQNSQ
jgi:AcrR family transcriptional regulator